MHPVKIRDIQRQTANDRKVRRPNKHVLLAAVQNQVHFSENNYRSHARAVTYHDIVLSRERLSTAIHVHPGRHGVDHRTSVSEKDRAPPAGVGEESGQQVQGARRVHRTRGLRRNRFDVVGPAAVPLAAPERLRKRMLPSPPKAPPVAPIPCTKPPSCCRSPPSRCAVPSCCSVRRHRRCRGYPQLHLH